MYQRGSFTKKNNNKKLESKVQIPASKASFFLKENEQWRDQEAEQKTTTKKVRKVNNKTKNKNKTEQ